ncbi:MAG TPA: hypothetical protein VGH79_09325 [Gaiellaceae bacterium]|jgi:hypothetical protein
MNDVTENSEDAAPDETFRVSVSGEGIALDRSIDRDAALQILSIAMGGAAPASPSVPGGPIASTPITTAGASGGTGGRLSLREFLNEVEAKRNPDKILAIGKYLQAQRGQETFSAADVKGQFKNAGEALPGNFPRDWTWAVTNGWIAEDHSARGTFYVTDTGDAALAAKFGGDVKKRTGVSKGTRRRRAAKQKADE